MKNITILRIATVLFMTIFFFAAKAENINPKNENTKSVINNEYITFSHESDLDSKMFKVSYDNTKGYFCLNSKVEISIVQILNAAGDLEFQIPIKNKRLYISLENFQEDDYIVNLQFAEETEFISTKLTKK